MVKSEGLNVYRKFVNVVEGLWRVVKINGKFVKVLNLKDKAEK